MPGSSSKIQLTNAEGYKTATLNGKSVKALIKGRSVKVSFEGEKLKQAPHRKLAELKEVSTPEDTEALYEATCFAADNNALEVRSLKRSGTTNIPQVQKARDAFFNQDVFIKRGIWDKNLFDGDMETGYWPSRKYNIDQKIKGGCFRLDLGRITDLDQIVIKVPDEFSLQPLLLDEGNYAEVSSDLKNWKSITYYAGEEMVIDIDESIRYLRLGAQPEESLKLKRKKMERCWTVAIGQPRTSLHTPKKWRHNKHGKPTSNWMKFLRAPTCRLPLTASMVPKELMLRQR